MLLTFHKLTEDEAREIAGAATDDRGDQDLIVYVLMTPGCGGVVAWGPHA